MEDRIALHYEKNGIFSVKSAYKLAASADQQSNSIPTSSSRDPGDRSIWDLVWKTKVPEKVKIFGWRVATNTLATKKNKCRRTITHDETCNICGTGDEDEYHAVVACTKSRALRFAMREHWCLPAEKTFWYTGDDWLQHLLGTESEEDRVKIMLLLWRCWHLQEDNVHGTGRESILHSVKFLQRYNDELEIVAADSSVDSDKSMRSSRETCGWAGS